MIDAGRPQRKLPGAWNVHCRKRHRTVAYAEAGADCLFVPFILDWGAVAELVAAVAPKPINVVVHDFDESILAFAALGVRRCSVGASLA